MIAEILHLDWETKSACDLKTCGLYVYASHPSTDILIASYAFDDGPVETWRPGQELPMLIQYHISKGKRLYAHNAPFEIAICNFVAHPKWGWPKIRPEQIFCTMAEGYAMSLPGKLEKLAPALGISNQKDMAGNRLMLKMSQPRNFTKKQIGELPHDHPFFQGEAVFHDSEEDFARLIEYGKQDIVVEREAKSRLTPLSAAERRVWLLDHKINERGIAVDLESIDTAISVVESEKKRLDLLMREATGNAVATCNANAALTDWLHAQGVETKGVTKGDVSSLLEKNAALPDSVRKPLLLRQEGAKSSTSKFKKMRDMAWDDGRIRGIFQYHGAGTGRWAGRGIQPQNFPRGKFGKDDIDYIFALFRGPHLAPSLTLLYDSPLSVMSELLRSFLWAPRGKKLLWGDFAAIEARVLAWLAGEERILNIFRGDGKIYEFTAAQIYHVLISQVTKAQRQIGKVANLALGFGGGKGAFMMMAKNLGVKVTEKEAEVIKNEWRAANPAIVDFWRKLETTAMAAIRSPNNVFVTGKIKYKKSGSFLWCQLPSDRVICYPYPKVEPVETPWGEMRDGITYMGEDSLTRKWEKQKAYGGLLAENVTQAVARDLLVDAMFRVERKEYPIVMHVHDEIVCEVREDLDCEQDMKKIMEEVPTWAAGLPIGCAVDSGKRYRK